ncbi:MAG: alanine dehydrogenase, partial [Aggregatilineales bacterium]
MRIGIPAEVKKDEHRVSLPPDAVRELVRRGHSVAVQSGAGMGSGFGNDEYTDAGADILDTAAQVWQQAEMVIKVKEPQPGEYDFMRPDLILFT